MYYGNPDNLMFEENANCMDDTGLTIGDHSAPLICEEEGRATVHGIFYQNLGKMWTR